MESLTRLQQLEQRLLQMLQKLPASIKTIGAQAFTGAKSVKTIVIKSASVKVAKTAFKGVNTKKMTIKVSGMSAKQLKAFKAQLKKAGFKGTVKKVSK